MFSHSFWSTFVTLQACPINNNSKDNQNQLYIYHLACMSLFTWNLASAVCLHLLVMKYIVFNQTMQAAVCMSYTWHTCGACWMSYLCSLPGNNGLHFLFFFSFFVCLFSFKVDNLWDLSPKILTKTFSNIKQYVGCSQIHILQLHSCTMGSVFKEAIYAKANSEMKKTFSLALMIHFLNDEFDKDTCE